MEIKKYTEEDILKLEKEGHCLKFKDLKQFIEKNQDLSDDSVVLIERVTDFYFKDNWPIYEVPDEFFPEKPDQFHTGHSISKRDNKVLIYSHY